jgi:hypothetical protein
MKPPTRCLPRPRPFLQAGMIKVTSGPLQRVGLNFVYMSPAAYDACQRAGLEV